jgi:hypothetical protein
MGMNRRKNGINRRERKERRDLIAEGNKDNEEPTESWLGRIIED